MCHFSVSTSDISTPGCVRASLPLVSACPSLSLSLGLPQNPKGLDARDGKGDSSQESLQPGTVVHSCNSRDLGGRGKGIGNSRPARAKLERPLSQNKNKRTGAVLCEALGSFPSATKQVTGVIIYVPLIMKINHQEVHKKAELVATLATNLRGVFMDFSSNVSAREFFRTRVWHHEAINHVLTIQLRAGHYIKDLNFPGAHGEPSTSSAREDTRRPGATWGPGW
jgi:hypothetical protein